MLALALTTGCARDPATSPSPTATGFASEEEAFAAAEAVYRAYVEAVNHVNISDPNAFEPVVAHPTVPALSDEKKSLTQMHAAGWTGRGTSRVVGLEVIFIYGDEASRTSTSGGRAWAQLELPPFSVTPPIHAYGARGTYSARAIVRYTAEFTLGRGWVPIDGVREIPTSATSIRIIEARTALFDHTCLEDPAGAGC